jgi:hypothetical protein
MKIQNLHNDVRVNSYSIAFNALHRFDDSVSHSTFFIKSLIL